MDSSVSPTLPPLPSIPTGWRIATHADIDRLTETAYIAFVDIIEMRFASNVTLGDELADRQRMAHRRHFYKALEDNRHLILVRDVDIDTNSKQTKIDSPPAVDETVFAAFGVLCSGSDHSRTFAEVIEPPFGAIPARPPPYYLTSRSDDMGKTMNDWADMYDVEGHYEIDLLAVHPSHRRQGYAREFLSFCQQLADLDDVPLDVRSTMEGRFVYRQAGFEMLDSAMVKDRENHTPHFCWMGYMRYSPPPTE